MKGNKQEKDVEILRVNHTSMFTPCSDIWHKWSSTLCRRNARLRHYKLRSGRDLNLWPL